MLQPSTLKFLKDLKKNNNKEWFDANRKRYEAAKADFAAFVQGVIDRFCKTDTTLSALSAKDCLFRINRDIRFSKDKSPYKTKSGTEGHEETMFRSSRFSFSCPCRFGGRWRNHHRSRLPC